MKKTLWAAAAALLLSLASATAAFAGTWVSDQAGTKYQNTDGSFATGWITAEDAKYYYLDSNGYLVTNTTTQDGYRVGTDGAWTSDTASRFVGKWGPFKYATGGFTGYTTTGTGYLITAADQDTVNVMTISPVYDYATDYQKSSDQSKTGLYKIVTKANGQLVLTNAAGEEKFLLQGENLYEKNTNGKEYWYMRKDITLKL